MNEEISDIELATLRDPAIRAAVAAAKAANRLDEAMEFVIDVANLTKDGEQADADSPPFVMENDDAYDTLNGLISDARQILGMDG